jgi:hypothetical protein
MCGKFPSSDISISRFLHIVLTNRKMFHPQSNICVGQIGQTILAFLTHPAIVGEIPIAGHRRFAVLRGQRNKASGAGQLSRRVYQHVGGTISGESLLAKNHTAWSNIFF